MKLPAIKILVVTFVAFLCSTLPTRAVERRALSHAQQDSFLSARTTGDIVGTFDSFCSLLFAVYDVAIHTESGVINRTRLNTPFPDFYQPTWAELFDAIARQTKSSWRYDASRDFWVFGAPSQTAPFAIAVLDGWKSHDEGLYVGYHPPTAPVALDVYVLGRYSATNQTEAAALFVRVREALALRFARSFKKDISSREMDDVPVGQLRALYFQTTSPTGIIWRQWVVVDSGMAFAIVSAIKPEQEKDILPDVLKMVDSFKILNAPHPGERDEVSAGTRPIPAPTH